MHVLPRFLVDIWLYQRSVLLLGLDQWGNLVDVLVVITEMGTLGYILVSPMAPALAAGLVSTVAGKIDGFDPAAPMKGAAFSRFEVIVFALLWRLIGVGVRLGCGSLRCLPRDSDKGPCVAVHAVDVVSDAHVGQVLLVRILCKWISLRKLRNR